MSWINGIAIISPIDLVPKLSIFCYFASCPIRHLVLDQFLLKIALEYSAGTPSLRLYAKVLPIVKLGRWRVVGRWGHCGNLVELFVLDMVPILECGAQGCVS